MDIVLYVHGKGGSANEAEHYKPLFPGSDVTGIDYAGFTPWDVGAEISGEVCRLKEKYDRIVLVANSIGAFFCMNADVEKDITHAYFISPVVDMERLIGEMMDSAGITEAELIEKKTVRTVYGEEISLEYLYYVREHPARWNVPTDILYGDNDNITPISVITGFCSTHNARLTVMRGGEHWFHTKEQMRFLDSWITNGIQTLNNNLNHC